MKIVIRIGEEVFDFFCGDWRIFWGMAMTIVLVELLGHLRILENARSFAGIIFIFGISLSLVSALKLEIPAKK